MCGRFDQDQTCCGTLLPDWFRAVAAVLLIAFGVVLPSGWLQQRFASATSAFSTVGDQWLRRFHVQGLGGQLFVGLLLGLVRAPCVDPTLGVAATLASQGTNLGQVALVMVLFGIGAGVPMVVLGLVSRRLFTTARGNLLQLGVYGKYLLGTLMVVLGLSILTGVDKRVEAWRVDISPAWLTEITTRF